MAIGTLANNFSGGTNNTTISTANSGSTSGNAFGYVSGSPKFSTTNATGLRSPMVAAMTSGTELGWNFTLSARTIFCWGYMYITAAPTALDFMTYCSGPSNLIGVYLSTTRKLSIRGGPRTADSALQSGTLPLNQWVRIEAKFVIGTTTSTSSCELRRYDSADSATPTEVTTATAQNFGTALPLSHGFSNHPSISSTLYWDNIGVSDIDFPAPLIAPLEGFGYPL